MHSLNFGRFVKAMILLLAIIILPVPCLGYVLGDINSDDQVGLEEAIYSLQVVSGFTIPVSGTIINVPVDVPTIQEAIDAAAEGDTINVAAGTYNEALTVAGKSLTITGAGIGVTIIDGGYETGIEIDHSSGVLVENLTVQNCEDGIHATNHSTVEINNTTVQSCSDRGIQIDDHSIGYIADSTIDGSGVNGIGVLLNSSAILTGSVTTQNNLRDGIFLKHNSSMYIYAATCISNNDGGAGFMVTNNSNIFLASDTSVAISGSGNEAISIGRSSVMQTTGGTIDITDSGGQGISINNAAVLDSRSAITVTGGLNEWALGVGAGSQCILREGSFETVNCAGGIEVGGESRFSNRDTVSITITQNLGGVAINIYDNSTFWARGGTFDIQNANGNGIVVSDESHLVMVSRGIGLNTTLQNNLYSAISVQNSTARLHEVIINNNSDHGIALYGHSYCQINDASITSNTGYGIWADNGSNLDVSDSTITGNNGTNHDVFLGFGSQSTITGGTIDGGLDCDSSALSRGDTVCP